MHTPPDKCPKCGSVATGADRDLFTNAPLIFNFNCESKQDALSGDIHESRLCMAWQRAQKAEALLTETTRERQILYARLLECDHTPEEIEQLLLEG